MLAERRRQLFAGPPDWFSAAYERFGPLPTLAWHDDIGRGYLEGVGEITSESTFFTNARTGTRWGKNAAGVYVSAPAGQTLSIPDGTGAYEFEARTNKCANFNANPTDLTGDISVSSPTPSIVPFASAPAAVQSAATSAGLANIVSAFLRIQGGSGDGIRFSGTVGNTNAHTLSVYGYVAAGTATLSFADGGSSVVLQTNFAKTTSANVTPSGTTQTLKVGLTAASSDVYVALNSLQEATFAIDSPVVVAGSSAPVGGDIRTGTALFNAIAAQAQTWFQKTSNVAGGTTPRFFETSGGPLQYWASNNTVELQNGANNATSVLGSGTYSGTVKTLSKFNSSAFSILTTGGSPGSSANALTLSGTVYFGNRAAGDRALNGQQQWLALWLTQPALTGITVP